MPIYEYVCGECGKRMDVLQKVNDPPPEKCESCGATHSLSRVPSRTSFVLKGGGWYSDLYGSSKKDAGTTKAESSSTTNSTGSSQSTTTTATPAPATSSTSGGDKK